MAVKKSELYSSIWAGCNKLRGGMDASEYKDYVLTLLFVKYISDKFVGDKYGALVIPVGAGFRDMVALVGSPTIGDDINKKILNPIKEANQLADFPDFNNPDKLGKGQAMVDTLSALVQIFNKPELDFSKNRAEGDDILGDAYEYLMRHFAKESGASKGEFYTPSEVSRILAKIIGINHSNSTAATTAYDPTCGSGSLLLKVADEAEKEITLYGQEQKSTTAGLARMNMILHNMPTGRIWADNTLAKPQTWDAIDGQLKTFDYCVANPPFSDKSWSDGVNVANDPFGRFRDYGIPPNQYGDYAFLLHILKSLKSTGKGACVLPHGILFRGGAEAEIRKNLLRKGVIKGIIGLPANLFYGTGIPACIVVLDKENAHARKGVFMVDASKGYVKDGSKNKLRDQDIHKIVSVYNEHIEIPGYSRMVGIEEISNAKNDYNLNIPRYIDAQNEEDIQSIEAHLRGGIPDADIDALARYWAVYPSLRTDLFVTGRAGFSELRVAQSEVKGVIYGHREFEVFGAEMDALFVGWRARATDRLMGLERGLRPKSVIKDLSDDLLRTYAGKSLVDKYDVYQHLMNYWWEVMQDDCYLIAVDGWGDELRVMPNGGEGLADVQRGGHKQKLVAKDFVLVDADLIAKRYFGAERAAIASMQVEVEGMTAQLAALKEEHGAAGGVLGDMEKITKAAVVAHLRQDKDELRGLVVGSDAHSEVVERMAVLKEYMELEEGMATTNKNLKLATAALDAQVVARYKSLTVAETKQLVVSDKWLLSIELLLKTEMERIGQRLTGRIKELAGRYAMPLAAQADAVGILEERVAAHLAQMGF
jgi:type I restriction enzyme M protein